MVFHTICFFPKSSYNILSLSALFQFVPESMDLCFVLKVIGHSYGADAIIDILDLGIVPHVILTCDPRKRWDFFRMKNFHKPSNLPLRWYNYYQHWQIGLLGYRVKGADLNQNVGFYRHTQIPKVPEVKAKLHAILTEEI
jgi:hypothetical protein